jgi:hypothetical protein
MTETSPNRDGKQWQHTPATPRQHQPWCHEALHDLLGPTEPDCASRYIAPGDPGDSDAFAFLVGPVGQQPKFAIDAPHGTLLDLPVARTWLLDQLALVDGALAGEKWPGLPVPTQAAPCGNCGRTFCGGYCNGGQR